MFLFLGNLEFEGLFVLFVAVLFFVLPIWLIIEVIRWLRRH